MINTTGASAVRRSKPATAALSGGPLSRFDLVERLVHWSTAVAMLTLIVTGAILYLPSLALRIGHRGLIENIHVITGLCLLGPLVLGLARALAQTPARQTCAGSTVGGPLTSTGSEAAHGNRDLPVTSSTAVRRSRLPFSGRQWSLRS